MRSLDQRSVAGRARNRDGFSLLEILVATSLLLFVLGISTQFLRRQSTGISQQSGRLEAQQNAYYGIASIERELRTAGVGVVDDQPIIVYAAPMAVVFNSNLVSRLPGDVAAVYVDVDADSNMTDGFRSKAQVKLPGTSTRYPDSTYMQGAGVASGAETIAFWLSKDSSSKASNEYVLWRRANATNPRVVAKGVVVNASDTVFQYFKADSSGALVPVVKSALPIYHSAMLHGAPNDTGKPAVIDSIRAVRIRFKTVYHDARTGDVTRRLERTVRITNGGLNTHTSCGDAPLSVVPVVTTSLPGAASQYVTLTWAASIDESNGEKDVERYAIYRRPSSVAAFTEPFASVPAGSATYSFIDSNVETGETWIYGVASLDCTPTMSSIGTTLPVLIP